MNGQTVCLDNGTLSVSILLPGETATNARYDQSGIVEQVSMGSHEFLGREVDAKGGPGLGGIGLSNVLEWQSTEIYDNTSFADHFPMLGVGLLKKTTTAPFLFTQPYEVIPYNHQWEVGEHSVSIRTLPRLCEGIAVEYEKTFTLEGQTLQVDFSYKNLGQRPVHATEFCHNFFSFDEKTVDSKYQLQLSYPISAKMRRGELAIRPDSYRLGKWDAATQSTAFWIHGYEGLQNHWMQLTHDDLPHRVYIQDDFPPKNFYSWNNDHAFCPEVFASIDLQVGEELKYRRSYTFSLA